MRRASVLLARLLGAPGASNPSELRVSVGRNSESRAAAPPSVAPTSGALSCRARRWLAATRALLECCGERPSRTGGSRARDRKVGACATNTWRQTGSRSKRSRYRRRGAPPVDKSGPVCIGGETRLAPLTSAFSCPCRPDRRGRGDLGGQRSRGRSGAGAARGATGSRGKTEGEAPADGGGTRKDEAADSRQGETAGHSGWPHRVGARGT